MTKKMIHLPRGDKNMEDICNFIPPKKMKSDLEFLHFVYETNIRKLRQPFIHSNFYINIVFKGTAILKFDEKTFNIKNGDLFFTFPGQKFTIDADIKFTFLYISFNGTGALPLLETFNINKQNCIFNNLDNVIPFWISAIRRINQNNANVLTESVLMYTLSFINTLSLNNEEQKKEKFESILDYINHNYTSNDMSIRKVADIFFYSEKYLSSLFKKKTEMKFSQYLNNLRIQRAINLLKNGETNISLISSKCGFTDPFYFSKVFKKNTGKTPREYIKSIIN